MAFSPEEIEIIKKGKELGRSRDDVVEALTRFRSGDIRQKQVTEPVVAPQQEVGFIEGIKQDFGQRVDTASDAQMRAISGEQDTRSATLQTVGQGAGFVGDLFMRGLSAITPDFIKEKLTQGVEAVAGTETAQDIAQKYSEWKLQNPEKAANLEAVANIASILPVGAVGAKGTQALAKGALVGTGKAIEGTADVLSKIGTPIKGAGSYLYKSAITPTAQEAKKILEYRARTPFLTRVATGSSDAPLTRGKTALEKGLMGTESAIGVQARQKADELWSSTIAPMVRESDVTMTKDELFTPALERIAAIEDPTRKKAMQDAYDALLEDYADYPNEISLEKAQALKRDLAKFTPQKIFKGQDVASELRTLQADMAGAIRQKTYNSFKDENIKKMYLDWANLDELTQVGIKAISEQKFKAGAGSLVGGLWDEATTPIKTIGGQVLYRVGDALEFQAPEGIKTFGQYLQRLGYSKPTSYNLPESEAGLGLSMKVKSGLGEGEKDLLLNRLFSLRSTDTMIKERTGMSSTHYLENIDMDTLERLDELAVKAQKPRGLTERDYAELKSIMDEVDGDFNQGAIPTTISLDENGTPIVKSKSGGLPLLADPMDDGGIYYHGTTPENKKSLLEFGIDTKKNTKGFAEQPEAFYMGAKSEAEMYGKDKVGIRVRAGETVKTLSTSSQEWADTVGKSIGQKQSADALKELRARGYDAINHGDEIEILNPKKFEVVDLTTNSLEAQAKGKSLEQFIKEQGTPVYHGGKTNKVEDIQIKRNAKKTKGMPDSAEVGFYTTKDKSFAQDFADDFSVGKLAKEGTEGVGVYEFIISPDARIATRNDLPAAFRFDYEGGNIKSLADQAKLGGSQGVADKAAKWAQDNGYDAVNFSSTDGAEIIILNKDVLKTRSQLTDIWKKANAQD